MNYSNTYYTNQGGSGAAGAPIILLEGLGGFAILLESGSKILME